MTDEELASTVRRLNIDEGMQICWFGVCKDLYVIDRSLYSVR